VRVHAISASAREKIEAAGGTVELLREPKEQRTRRHRARPETTGSDEADTGGEETPSASEPATDAEA
jgi:hypothetical protein